MPTSISIKPRPAATGPANHVSKPQKTKPGSAAVAPLRAKRGVAADSKSPKDTVARVRELHSLASTPKRQGESTTLAKAGGSIGAPGGLRHYVATLTHATPLERMQFEREGIAGSLLKAMATEMQIPTMRFYDMIGVPKATAEQKIARNQPIAGASGHAALGVARLLGMVSEMLAHSTAPDAENFDAAKWLGQWLERAQPALGGKKPADFLDTPTGFEVVSRTLGAIESGAYL